MDFQIPEELVQLQRMARQFVRQELLPVEQQVERTGEFDEEVRRKLKRKAIDLGLWAYAAPVEHGGGGVNALGDFLVHEALGEVSIAVGLQGGVVGSCGGIGLHGEQLPYTTPEQARRYFLPVVQGKKEAYIALTEPNAGSDTRALQTTARRAGDGYLLNGTKTFITCAQRSDFGLFFAKTDRRDGGPGVSCFIVERDTPGLHIGRHIPMMGRSGLPSYEVVLQDCRIPVGNRLGEEGDGLRIAHSFLSRHRVLLVGYCAGLTDRVLAMAARHARERWTSGQPLIKRQLVQSKLMDMWLTRETMQKMGYNLAWRLDRGEDPRAETAALKAFATEGATRAVDHAIQIHGGLGYSRDLPLEMLYRDIRGYTIADGATEVLISYAAQHLFGEG